MLSKVKEMDIYIEANDVDSVSKSIDNLDFTGSASVSNVKTNFNGIYYVRISAFLTEENAEKLFEYLKTDYSGKAIVIE